MEQGLTELKQKFYDFLQQHYASRPRQKPPTEEDYVKIIDELKVAKGKVKAKAAKTSHEIHLLQRYEIVVVGESSKLVLKKELEKAGGQRPSMVYLPTYEQLFDLVHEAHTRCGHGGIQNTYKSVIGWDVPKPAVEMYLKCCEGCALKVKYKLTLKNLS